MGVENIKHKIMVMSGKGGVGKSTVAVNTAYALRDAGYSVGLLDIDIHGPSVPNMTGTQDEQLKAADEKLIPIEKDGIKIISIGYLLDGRDRAVIWRGPLKYKLLMQFLGDVTWGDLDYLIIDAPPGTGDEPLTIMQNVNDLAGAIIVTTPQDIALLDVEKAIDLCRQMDRKIIGVVENMSIYVCPDCGRESHIFGSHGAKKLEEQFEVKTIGRLPLLESIAENADKGVPAYTFDSTIQEHYRDIVKHIEDAVK